MSTPVSKFVYITTPKGQIWVTLPTGWAGIRALKEGETFLMGDYHVIDMDRWELIPASYAHFKVRAKDSQFLPEGYYFRDSALPESFDVPVAQEKLDTSKLYPIGPTKPTYLPEQIVHPSDFTHGGTITLSNGARLSILQSTKGLTIRGQWGEVDQTISFSFEAADIIAAVINGDVELPILPSREDEKAS